MPPEPATKRTIAFVDGQNLFYAAKEAFGCTYPNYAPLALARAVCAAQGWQLTAARFYTGVPDAQDNPFWNHFWTAKLAAMGTRGINGTDWIKVDRHTYDACTDPADYRPKKR